MEMTPHMKEVEAQSQAQVEAMIHSDDPVKRCIGTMRKAIILAFRDALTGLMVEENEPDHVLSGAAEALGACVAMAAYQYGGMEHGKSNICVIVDHVHDLAHKGAESLVMVPIAVGPGLTITDLETADTP